MSDSPRPAPVSFPEFAPLTTEAWQERIRRDLKGADPATLVWESPEGLAVAPFYHREALAALGDAPAPQLRPTRGAAANPWLNLPTLRVSGGTDGRTQIDYAVHALRHGADGVHFDLEDAARFDVNYLAVSLPLASTPLGFTVGQAPDHFLERLIDVAEGQALRGFLRYAPGPGSPADASQIQAQRRCVVLTRRWPDFMGLTLNGSFYSHRGASIVQELAYTLSTAVAFLSNLPTEELSAAEVAASLHVHVSIGTSYFFELAKLRALRRLWATVLHAFGLPPEQAAYLRIHARTSAWTQTTLDPYTNLLRVTTEAMSAVLGGADSISVSPYDSLYAEDNDFSARIARNVPVLLREEAHLDRVADPAAGSYYLETLTDQLAREAWAEFQRVEAAGGLMAARGQMLEDIRQVAMEKFHRIANGQQIIVGTNRYQDAHEQFSFDPKALLRSPQFDTTRAAYPSEVLRLATAMHFIRKEQKKKKAAVVLLGADTIPLIYDLFVRTLPAAERPAVTELPDLNSLSLLFSSPEEATLMSATDEQFRAFAHFITDGTPEIDDPRYAPPALLAADLPTLQEAVKVFGFREFVVKDFSTEDILSRLQGR